jgi:hypothetical protein
LDTVEYFEKLNEILDRYLNSGDFWSCEIEIPETEIENWICMRSNPKHFSTSMFLGKWSVDGKFPSTSSIRLVRAMELPDDSLRIVGRQGDNLFVLILALDPSQH